MTTTFFIILGIIAFIIIWFLQRQFRYSKEVVNYDVFETKEKIKQNKNVILLDVRTNMERRSKVIQGSVHMPLHDLKHSVEKLKEQKDKEIICYCHSGMRSLSAAYILKQHGFKSANMKGGIVAWLSFEKKEKA